MPEVASLLADEMDAGRIDKVPGRKRYAHVTSSSRRRPGDERSVIQRRRRIIGPADQAANDGKREASREKCPAIHVRNISRPTHA